MRGDVPGRERRGGVPEDRRQVQVGAASETSHTSLELPPGLRHRGAHFAWWSILDWVQRGAQQKSWCDSAESHDCSYELSGALVHAALAPSEDNSRRRLRWILFRCLRLQTGRIPETACSSAMPRVQSADLPGAKHGLTEWGISVSFPGPNSVLPKEWLRSFRGTLCAQATLVGGSSADRRSRLAPPSNKLQVGPTSAVTRSLTMWS